MPKEKQDYAIFPNGKSSAHRRRVIVSSPIAEASLTLERVTCVIDSGLRREARCDVDTGMPRLVTTRCSKASARQRAGRAGRVQEGLCLRLYSESEYESSRFVDHSPPEVLQTDLVPTLLLLSDWGCSGPADVYEIKFVDPPQQSSLRKAYETLVFLEALEETNDDRYS
jgi:ATP-dependent helicase HrpB